MTICLIVVHPKELAKAATPTTQTKHKVYDSSIVMSYRFMFLKGFGLHVCTKLC